MIYTDAPKDSASPINYIAHEVWASPTTVHFDIVREVDDYRLKEWIIERLAISC